MILLKVNWAPSESLFEFFGIGVRFYSLMFVIAFSYGFYLMKKIFKKEDIKIEYLDPILFYMVLSTLIGARLGHVFFYDWNYYQNHLLEILLPIREIRGSSMLFGTIEGYKFIGYRGLASHGAVIGILIGIALYQRQYKFRSWIWILDRLTIPATIGGAFVRLGNFYNSEIVGKFTNSSFGVVFQNNGERLPRHPAQLYEAFGYVILFFLLRSLYNQNKTQKGFLLGVYFTGIFSIRFLVEYVKESQGGFEKILPMLSTGQWLSIPLVLFGIGLIVLSNRKTA
ncbi:MAG: prolipoprotein diacylglyceryl transferase [Flavobacteriales bacterium]|jgi:phosphatidylglycerol:prolipoprotein diacylglycerol transferase|nr:prolipoprotein diacylglyceryl transferase [Flavobacteriales bacterium]